MSYYNNGLILLLNAKLFDAMDLLEFIKAQSPLSEEAEAKYQALKASLEEEGLA